jgi:hypothetical protein
MSLETYELDKKMLEYSISQFRAIPEYVKLCEAFAVGLESIQSGVDYLSDMIDKDKAEGVWLDYIGILVGQKRSEYVDTDKCFCVNKTDTQIFYQWVNNGEYVYTEEETPLIDDEVVNSQTELIGKVISYSNDTITVSIPMDEIPEHNEEKTYSLNGTRALNIGDVNKSKFFYFPNSSINSSVTTLSDELFQGQINAKIAYNISNGTREDNIRIIKPLVNATKVVIENVSPMELKITVYGKNVITNNIKERIESVLAPGVGVYGEVIVIDENDTI